MSLSKNSSSAERIHPSSYARYDHVNSINYVNPLFFKCSYVPDNSAADLPTVAASHNINPVSLLLANVRSLGNKLPEFLHLLYTENQDNIVCLTETWLTGDTPDSVLHSNIHQLFRMDRPYARGGGIVIYVPHYLNPSLVLSHCDTDFEIIGVRIRVHSRIVIVLCVYRPPHNYDCANMVTYLDNYISSTKSPCLIVGDFNCPKISWSTYSCCPGATLADQQLLNFIRTSSFVQYVNEPTRCENILDLALSNDNNLISQVAICPPIGDSDHNTIVLQLNLTCARRPPRVPYRDFRRADYDAINNILIAISWPDLFNSCITAEDFWAVFQSVIDSIIDLYVPLAMPLPKKRTWPSDAYRMYCQKHNLHKRLKTATPADKTKIRLEIKIVARNLRTALSQIQSRSETNILRNANVKDFWAYINGRLSVKPKIPSLLMANDTIVDDNKNKCAALSSQFSMVFKQDNCIPVEITTKAATKLKIVRFEPSLVYNELIKLRPKLSRGPDGIPALFLKRTALTIAEPLSTIFTRSFSTGRVPSAWKLSDIVPVPKKPGANRPGDFRPISMTSILCRTFERLIRDPIVNHLETNHLISPYQHGFRRHRSTTTQLLECVHSWASLIECKIPVDVIYMDVAKAFDTVVHSKLITKLAAYGIDGLLLAWIADFLQSRQQRVRIEDSYSDWDPVVSGVPQGSVLGPLLFLVFINDLPDFIDDVGRRLFADDLKLFNRVDTKCEQNKLQIALNKVWKWCTENQLDLSPSKCQILHVGNKNPRVDFLLGDHKLETVTFARDLGVVISEDFRFTRHCETIVTKASARANGILRAFTNRDSRILMQLFDTFVLPLLEYASVIWSPSIRQEIELIESVQRKFTKRIPGLRNLTYEDRLSLLNRSSLENRRHKQDLLFLWALINGSVIYNGPFGIRFASQRCQTTRGHNFKLTMPNLRTNLLRKMFPFRVIPAWNSLPPNVVNAKSIGAFKRRLSYWLAN